MSIYEQFQETLSKGRLPLMEFELSTGDFLVVGIMVEQGHTSVSADFLCLPVWFEGGLAAVSGSEYRINLEDYPFQNTDMSALIKIVLNQSEGTDQAALLLVKAAYKEHRYSTESIKQRTIQDFKNQAFLACYK